MFGVYIKFPQATTITIDTGDSFSFPENTWVYYKPKWSNSVDMLEVLELGKQYGVVVRDWNLDEFDTSTMTNQEARDLFVRCLAWLNRHS